MNYCAIRGLYGQSREEEHDRKMKAPAGFTGNPKRKAAKKQYIRKAGKGFNLFLLFVIILSLLARGYL